MLTYYIKESVNDPKRPFLSTVEFKERGRGRSAIWAVWVEHESAWLEFRTNREAVENLRALGYIYVGDQINELLNRKG